MKRKFKTYPIQYIDTLLLTYFLYVCIGRRPNKIRVIAATPATVSCLQEEFSKHPHLEYITEVGTVCFSALLNTWNVSQRWEQYVLNTLTSLLRICHRGGIVCFRPFQTPHFEYITEVGTVCSPPFQTPSLGMYHRGGNSMF